MWCNLRKLGYTIFIQIFPIVLLLVEGLLQLLAIPIPVEYRISSFTCSTDVTPNVEFLITLTTEKIYKKLLYQRIKSNNSLICSVIIVSVDFVVDYYKDKRDKKYNLSENEIAFIEEKIKPKKC